MIKIKPPEEIEDRLLSAEQDEGIIDKLAAFCRIAVNQCENKDLAKQYIDEIQRFVDQYCLMKHKLSKLEMLINNPEIDDFLEGVKIEAAHQTERWGITHEETKFPHDYALVIDKLKGKQAISIWDKNTEKYKHHLITMAATCFNSHRQVGKAGTNIHKYFNE